MYKLMHNVRAYSLYYSTCCCIHLEYKLPQLKYYVHRVLLVYIVVRLSLFIVVSRCSSIRVDCRRYVVEREETKARRQLDDSRQLLADSVLCSVGYHVAIMFSCL